MQVQRPRGRAKEKAQEVGKREPNVEIGKMTPSVIKDEKDRYKVPDPPLGPIGGNLANYSLTLVQKPGQTSNLHIHKRDNVRCLPL